MIGKPSFKEALKFWLKLGFISFGGPAGQIAIMHEFVVQKKKWISESRFMHALNYCMLLPGPEAQQLATYIGWLLHGRLGGLAAGILFILPSLFILLAMSVVYVNYGNIPWIYAMFNGLKPAVIAIVILALIKIGKKSLLGPFHVFISIAAFVLIAFFKIPFPLIIIGSVILSLILKQWKPELLKLSDQTNQQLQADESMYYIHHETLVEGAQFSKKRLAFQLSAGVVLWVLPLLLFFLFAPEFNFWNQLVIFFTKAAFVTFGGAYAVLPYVAQVSVDQFGWLSSLEMIDGLALGETTPGPLIMVLAFVGFMAGYNHFGLSILMGSVGLLATTYYTFLPCFIFVLAGAPLIEQTKGNQQVKNILAITTAAVVGVVFNLTIYLGNAVVFPEAMRLDAIQWPSLIWIIISGVAMYKYNIGMIKWILASAIFGLCSYLMS